MIIAFYCTLNIFENEYKNGFDYIKRVEIMIKLAFFMLEFLFSYYCMKEVSLCFRNFFLFLFYFYKAVTLFSFVMNDVKKRAISISISIYVFLKQNPPWNFSDIMKIKKELMSLRKKIIE